MSRGRACPTYSARDRSMHHLFWNCSSRRIPTSTYGNLIHLKFSNQGWTWSQHKHSSPLSQHVSNRIRTVFENGMIEAYRHRSLELARCWLETLSTLASAIRRFLVHDILMEWNLTYVSGCKGYGRRSIDQVQLPSLEFARNIMWLEGWMTLEERRQWKKLWRETGNMAEIRKMDKSGCKWPWAKRKRRLHCEGNSWARRTGRTAEMRH